MDFDYIGFFILELKYEAKPSSKKVLALEIKETAHITLSSNENKEHIAQIDILITVTKPQSKETVISLKTRSLYKVSNVPDVLTGDEDFNEQAREATSRTREKLRDITQVIGITPIDLTKESFGELENV